MNAIMPLVILVIIGTVLYFSFAYSKRSRERRAALLDQLAQRVGGEVDPGTWSRQPVLRFSHRGQHARLTFYSTGGKNPTLYTRLFIDLSRIQQVFKIHIYPERFFSRVGKVLGAQDIQLGDPAFDESFIIKGFDESRVRRFLLPGVTDAMRELRRLAGNDHLDVATDGPQLRIQKLSWLDAPDLLRSFCELGRQVADGYLDAVGAQPDTPARAVAAASEDCPVCSHAVSGSAKTCPSCSAIHHPECWQLNDGCGICGAA